MSKKNHPRQNHDTQDETAGFSHRVRFALTAFIAFNLFAIVAWCIPLETPLVAGFRSFVRPYLIFTGLFQKWDMFAPDPSKTNNFVGALVTYRDGNDTLWMFPRMENLGVVDKYFAERFRKYANDCLALDMYSKLWPDAARYVARANYRPGNPPVRIQLVRYWSIVPAPNSGKGAPWSQYVFFRYDVAQGDLP